MRRSGVFLGAAIIAALLLWWWLGVARSSSSVAVIEIADISSLQAEGGCVSRSQMSKRDFLRLLPDDQVHQARALPRFTKQGYLQLRLPEELHASLTRAFEERRGGARVEPAGHAVLTDGRAGGDPLMTYVADTQEELMLRRWLATALQKWTGLSALAHSATYGVRTYRRGSTLKAHVDRIRTHVLSAIVQVARRDLDEEWALDIVPHDEDAVLSVRMPPSGNCLLYESATLPHARLSPLKGEEYSNLFVHFAPTDWSQTLQKTGFGA